MEARTKFRAGLTYRTRSVGDHNCIVSVTVARRTAKTIITTEGKTLRISEYRGVEQVKPWGSYSMAPIVDATDTAPLLRDLEKDAPADPPGYAARVRALEAEGLTRSDAQGVADAEFRQVAA